MSWRQDMTRPVKWTRDGRLVYDDYKETDPVLIKLKAEFRALIDGVPTNDRDHKLAVACGAWIERKAELELNI